MTIETLKKQLADAQKSASSTPLPVTKMVKDNSDEIVLLQSEKLDARIRKVRDLPSGTKETGNFVPMSRTAWLTMLKRMKRKGGV